MLHCAVVLVILLLHCCLEAAKLSSLEVHFECLLRLLIATCPSYEKMVNDTNKFQQDILAILNSCGGPAWRRVGYLDMTDPSQSCPSGLALKTYPQELRVCGRVSDVNVCGGCWSTFYSTGGSQYSRVCGRIRGYQFGATDAFFNGHQGLDSFYMDGVSLTHGQSGSRAHIWTFAAARHEIYDGRQPTLLCPCATSDAPSPPLFVGNDYFCESGLRSLDTFELTFYPDDPLWDGQNCVNSCCEFNNPPYFTKTLPAPTSDDIVTHLCWQWRRLWWCSNWPSGALCSVTSRLLSVTLLQCMHRYCSRFIVTDVID